ncbi:hypothetical protein [Yersinia alsatica]|nr:hypothetical protein [Yersinia alsatica]
MRDQGWRIWNAAFAPHVATIKLPSGANAKLTVLLPVEPRLN